jgi:transcriptional regulator with XRE-family HTH domain
MPEVDRDLIDQFIRARKDLGLKQGVVAEKLGVVQPTVCRWEDGNNSPNLEQSQRWANVLGAVLILSDNTNGIRRRALTELARRHPGELDALMTAERYRMNGESPTVEAVAS